MKYKAGGPNVLHKAEDEGISGCKLIDGEKLLRLAPIPTQTVVKSSTTWMTGFSLIELVRKLHNP